LENASLPQVEDVLSVVKRLTARKLVAWDW
jgi:hypothetical protein